MIDYHSSLIIYNKNIKNNNKYLEKKNFLKHTNK